MAVYSNFQQNMIDSFINISALYPAQEYRMGDEPKEPLRTQLKTLIGKINCQTGEILFGFKAQNQNPADDQIVVEVTFHRVDRRCFLKQNLTRIHYGTDREVHELYIRDKFLIESFAVTKTINELEKDVKNAEVKANAHLGTKSNPSMFDAFIEECKQLFNGC